MHNMKENYNHGCYYISGSYTPFKDDLSYIIHETVLYNDNDEVLVEFNVIENSSDTYETIRPKIDNILELAENLVQMSDMRICEWLIANEASCYKGYSMYYVPDHQDFYYEIKIGNYGLFDPN